MVVVVVPHLSRDEGRVSNDHIELAPHVLGNILRLGEVVEHETRVLRPLGVKLNAHVNGAYGRGRFGVGMTTPTFSAELQANAH